MTGSAAGGRVDELGVEEVVGLTVELGGAPAELGPVEPGPLDPPDGLDDVGPAPAEHPVVSSTAETAAAARAQARRVTPSG